MGSGAPIFGPQILTSGRAFQLAGATGVDASSPSSVFSSDTRNRSSGVVLQRSFPANRNSRLWRFSRWGAFVGVYTRQEQTYQLVQQTNRCFVCSHRLDWSKQSLDSTLVLSQTASSEWDAHSSSAIVFQGWFFTPKPSVRVWPKRARFHSLVDH